MTFADRVLAFNKSLAINKRLPAGVGVLNPFDDDTTFTLCSQFYHKYYNDKGKRRIILGINPGRHGAGLTGVPFTDPIKLEKFCGIHNTLPKKPELSADFIYAMINTFGGPEAFYKRYYISAVSPLGFVKDGKNLNYYDIRALQDGLKDFIATCLHRQLDFGIDTSVCFCLGEGTNFKYIQRLNAELKIFDAVEPLPHPRFIMQYKRKLVPHYIDIYLGKLAV